MTRPQSARPAHDVVTAIVAELARQKKFGSLAEVGMPTREGSIFIAGNVDLAMLAHVTELALRDAFVALRR